MQTFLSLYNSLKPQQTEAERRLEMIILDLMESHKTTVYKIESVNDREGNEITFEELDTDYRLKNVESGWNWISKTPATKMIIY